jgi:hypothetical protein
MATMPAELAQANRLAAAIETKGRIGIVARRHNALLVLLALE